MKKRSLTARLSRKLPLSPALATSPAVIKQVKRMDPSSPVGGLELSSAPAGALELAEAQAKREALISEALGAATGVGPNKRVANRLLAQFNSLTGDPDIATAMFMLAEFRPANMLETMLVTQMVGVHEAALGCLRILTRGVISEELRDQIASRAARLMRLFNEQLDQLQRIRGATRQQRVTVEHVHVNAGGQAIVGVVGNNPHPKSLSAPDLHVPDGAATVGGPPPSSREIPNPSVWQPRE